MNNEIKAQKNKEIAVIYEVDGEQIKLTPSIVQNYLVGTSANITKQEFMMFTALCKARKLNPFVKEAYLIKYSDKQAAQMVVSKDVILRRAILHSDYNGIEDGIIVTNENGEIIERKGCFKLPNETLVGAWAKVYRKSWTYPVYCSVSFDEVAQKKSDGSLNTMWSSKGATMANKVAKCRALREAFVEEFSGMYDEAEMPQPKNTADTDSYDTMVIEQEEPIENQPDNTISMDEI